MKFSTDGMKLSSVWNASDDYAGIMIDDLRRHEED